MADHAPDDTTDDRRSIEVRTDSDRSEIALDADTWERLQDAAAESGDSVGAKLTAILERSFDSD